MKKFYKTTIMMMICLFIAHSAFADVSADFTANQTTIVAGETIQFTDLSSGNPTTWQWDFQNDGTIDSEEQNPNFTYNEAGTYSVSLAVSDGTNEDTELKVDYITVENTTWQCGDPFTDTRDEQTYNSALIGGQCWMAENLNIGTMINGNTNMTNNSVIEKYCYDNDLANCEIYGGLYQWNEMMQYVTDTVVQGICPESWHLPTDFEWKILEGTVDSQYPVGDPIWNNIGSRGYDAGINLKSTTGWNINTGTDAFGFTALPAGCRNSSGDFNSLGYYGYFWSSAEGSTSNAWSRYLGYSSGSVDRLDYGKSYGFSVRCLQDEYIPQEKTVTTEANPPEGGTTAGDGTYLEGTEVTVNVYPSIDWEFINWTVEGVEVSIEAEYIFIVEGDISLVANFEYFAPPQLGIISGTVTESETDNPIEGAEVVVEGTAYSAFTGSDGTYSIEDVAVGIYSVTASVDGYYPLTIPDQEVIFNQTTIVNFSLTPEEQHFLFEGGNAADPVWTIYISTAIFDDLDLQANDEIGVFDGELLVGVYYLSEILTPENWTNQICPVFSALSTQPGYTPGNPVLFKCWDASEQQECSCFMADYSDPYGGAWTENSFPPGDGQYSILDLTFNTGGTVSGAVNLNGGPGNVTDVVITLNGVYTNPNGDGFYEITGVEPGNHVVSATLEAYYDVFETTEVIAGETSTIDFTLNPEVGNIEGTITDYVTGVPIDGVQIILEDFYEVFTDETGYYLFENVLIGTYNLSIEFNGYYPEEATDIVVIIDETIEVNFALHPIHFQFQGGNPADPIWTIYLAEGTLDEVDLQCYDEIAIFDGDIMVGEFTLTEILTPENQFNNTLIVWSTLYSGENGYTSGNEFSLKCWDASEGIEAANFDITFYDPYGDAYVGDVFPDGDGQYSIVGIDFVTTITQFYSLQDGFQFVSSRVIPEDQNMQNICNDILDNLDFVRNTAGYMLRKIGPMWVNGIGDWITTEGYIFRMNDIDEFEIEGMEMNPQTPISLTDGYQFISYLPENPIDAQVVFNDVLDNLDFVRNSTGYMLRKIGPMWVNGIGDLIPCEGYLVRMNNPDVLIYPASFTCGDPFTDPRDEQTYTTVQIGDQCWMAENLNIGTMINGLEEMTNNNVIEKYCYINDPANCDTYGGLYQWNEMMEYSTTPGVQGICPSGWHLPTDGEWTVLTDFLGGESVAGGKMKETGTTHWNSPNTGATNESGFTALPVGLRFTNGNFNNFGSNGYFWSSTEYCTTSEFLRSLSYNGDGVDRSIGSDDYGLSVRCLQGYSIIHTDVRSPFDILSIQEKNLSYELTGQKVKNLAAPNFKFEGGNAADPVYTIYIEGLEIGDEVAAYDGDIIVGAVKINSQNVLDNDLPVFSTINSGKGFKTGKPIILKVWDASSQSLIPFEYTMTDPYNEAYMGNIYPEDDGLYSVIKITKGNNIENANKNISIFPNPSEGIFNVSIEGVSGTVQIKVFDIHGNDYRFIEIEGTNSIISEKLDLHDLSAGVYFISFSGKDFSRVKKIVIQ